jgi:hypothetical protein
LPTASLKTSASREPPWASTGSIAYKCGDSLCLVRPDGTGNRNLLKAARSLPQWDPAFSPDGRMLAFRGYYGVGDGEYALLSDAREIAETRGHAIVGTEHLLLAMTRQSDGAFARRLLDEVGATEALRLRIEAVIGED